MKHNVILAVSLVACGSTAPRSTSTPAPAAFFELGEIALFEDGAPVVKIHADGSTEMGYRSGALKIEPGVTASSNSLPLKMKAGPTIRTDGTFAYKGRDVVRLTADGTFVALDGKHGPIHDITVTPDKIAFAHTELGDISLDVAADGSVVQNGGNKVMGALRLEGADTPAKRRAILAYVALMLAPKGKADVQPAERVESVEPVPAPAP